MSKLILKQKRKTKHLKIYQLLQLKKNILNLYNLGYIDIIKLVFLIKIKIFILKIKSNLNISIGLKRLLLYIFKI